MRYLSSVRILVLAFMTSLSVLNGIAEDKTNITESHPGWLTYTTNSLTFFYAPDSVLAKDDARNKLALKFAVAYDNIGSSLQLTNEPPVKIFVYDNGESANKLLGRRADFARTSLGIVHSSMNAYPGHEICHVIADTAINGGKFPPNIMLSEGLAMWVDESGRDKFARAKGILEQGKLQSSSDGAKARQCSEVDYHSACAYVGYLLTTYGADKFKQLYRADKAEYDGQFQRIYGKSLAEMETEWRAFLKSYQPKTSKAIASAAKSERKEPSFANAVEFNGHHYFAVQGKLSWHEAKEKCEKMGGHLAIIKDEKLNDFLGTLAKDIHRVWIGLTDEKKDGEWKWVDGSDVTFTDWHFGTLERAGETPKRSYVEFSVWNGSPQWETRQASGELTTATHQVRTYGYICEWDR